MTIKILSSTIATFLISAMAMQSVFANDLFQPQMNESAVQHFKSAQSMRKAGRYKESITTLKAIVEKNPDYFLAWYNLGLAYTGMNDFKNGAEALEKAIQLQIDLLSKNAIKPEFTIYNTTAWAFMQLQQYDKAERYLKVSYDNLSKLPSKDSQSRVLNNYGLIKLQKKDYDGAKKMFNAALALGNPIARDNLNSVERLRKLRS